MKNKESYQIYKIKSIKSNLIKIISKKMLKLLPKEINNFKDSNSNNKSLQEILKILAYPKNNFKSPNKVTLTSLII